MITIIDSGGANIYSIHCALARLGINARVSHDASIIKKSTHLILPGVGSAHYAMTKLNDLALIQVIRELTQPVLGICLGMQILFEFSEEGDVECLGILPGKIKKLPDAHHNLSIPHMGWNIIRIIKENPLMKNVDDFSYAYYVHSYFAPLGLYTTATTCHGVTFSAMIQHRNFYGTQFHPERSSDVGCQVLKNFVEL